MIAIARPEDERLSVIVPLAERLPEDWLARCLTDHDGSTRPIDEVVIAASDRVPDTVVASLERQGCRVTRSPAARGSRLRHAVAESRGDVLLFLHGDTRIESGGIDELRTKIDGKRPWGAFRLRFENRHAKRCLPLVSFGANARSKLTGLPFGDQGQWCSRAAYESVGGHPPWNFLEDLELALRLRRLARPTLLRARATTSARRYERRGRLRSVFMNARILTRFALGADVGGLEAMYRSTNPSDALSREPDRSTVARDGCDSDL